MKEFLGQDKHNYILNGDYSAATDHLKLDVVKTVALAITERISKANKAKPDELLSLWEYLTFKELIEPQYIVPAKVPKGM